MKAWCNIIAHAKLFLFMRIPVFHCFYLCSRSYCKTVQISETKRDSDLSFECFMQLHMISFTLDVGFSLLLLDKFILGGYS